MDEFALLISEANADTQDTAREARAVIRTLVPEATEVVTPGYRSVSFGYGTRLREQFLSLVLYDRHVRLQIHDSTEVVTNRRLLERTGDGMPHIKLRRPRDLQAPELKKLICEVRDQHVPSS